MARVSDLASRLERLAAKYRALAELRARREEAVSVGLAGFTGDEAAARRAAFRALAREFPGALRELDTLAAATLRARLADVERELSEARAEPGRAIASRRWIAVAVDYHETLRAALALKLRLARRLPRGGAVTEALARELGADAAVLESHLRPPGGRLHALVWDALERRHGLPRAELERLVFGGVPARTLVTAG